MKESGFIQKKKEKKRKKRLKAGGIHRKLLLMLTKQMILPSRLEPYNTPTTSLQSFKTTPKRVS